MSIQTVVNFGGFYESIHEEKCEEAVISSNNWDNEDTGELKEEHADDLYSYNKWGVVHELYSKEYIDKLNDELETGIKYKELISPRFYNFGTDVIFVEITRKDCLKLFEYIRFESLENKVKEHIKDRTAASSGFRPFFKASDFYKRKHRDLLIETLLTVIINFLNEDYPFFVEDNIYSPEMEV